MSDNLANPAPLGLMGFGMTTVLLNIHNAGLFEISAVIMAMGIFYGGIAQIIAGCMEFKKGNTFGTTAFTSYGSFWLTLVFLIYFNGKFGLPANPVGFMACYLFMWGLFTFFMWIATWKANRGLQGPDDQRRGRNDIRGVPDPCRAEWFVAASRSARGSGGEPGWNYRGECSRTAAPGFWWPA